MHYRIGHRFDLLVELKPSQAILGAEAPVFNCAISARLKPRPFKASAPSKHLLLQSICACKALSPSKHRLLPESAMTSGDVLACNLQQSENIKPQQRHEVPVPGGDVHHN